MTRVVVELFSVMYVLSWSLHFFHSVSKPMKLLGLLPRASCSRAVQQITASASMYVFTYKRQVAPLLSHYAPTVDMTSRVNTCQTQSELSVISTCTDTQTHAVRDMLHLHSKSQLIVPPTLRADRYGVFCPDHLNTQTWNDSLTETRTDMQPCRRTQDTPQDTHTVFSQWCHHHARVYRPSVERFWCLGAPGPLPTAEIFGLKLFTTRRPAGDSLPSRVLGREEAPEAEDCEEPHVTMFWLMLENLPLIARTPHRSATLTQRDIRSLMRNSDGLIFVRAHFGSKRH